MKISTPAEVQQYYQQEKVAQRYISKRFTEPLNVVEHRRQAAVLNQIIRERQCRNILEFAPGPARLTAELDAEGGTSIDSSREMLEIAKRRMRQAGKKWDFVPGNILDLKFRPRHDLVFCIRFLLHFKLPEREKIYAQARSALLPGGFLAFEAMNGKVVRPLRKILGKRRYMVYDKLYQRKELIEEVRRNGFEVIKLYPLLNHFWLQAVLSRPFKWIGLYKIASKIVAVLERYPSVQPYEWAVLCRKK